ncbi:endo alpha-1,4 polygalactosaminidase [Marisediminicola sp. LYQ134]|uniref:endo alpha-1,4 polygalactosaminidase n=1 Tax=Marisediminicola sp. LYQ134 TaxID=3391061 RepID=UPI0039833770
MRPAIRHRALAGLAVVAALAGCAPLAEDPASTSPGGAAPTGAVRAIESLPEGILVDYQLGGGYAPAPGVEGVVRDSTDVPEPGLYSICYVNAFQSQPGDREEWLDERPELVLTGEGGEPVVDPGWPDELLLDTSTATNRARLAEFVDRDIRSCASAGFSAVEFDNLDSFSRSGGALSVDAAMDFARLIVDLAHESGLAAAQKNAVEFAERARAEAGFDFAVVEQCHEFDECAVVAATYGDAVVDVEYSDASAFADACADPDRVSSTIRRDRDLTTPDSPDHVFEACR